MSIEHIYTGKKVLMIFRYQLIVDDESFFCRVNVQRSRFHLSLQIFRVVVHFFAFWKSFSRIVLISSYDLSESFSTEMFQIDQTLKNSKSGIFTSDRDQNVLELPRR